MVEIGNIAPQFTLYNTQKEVETLSDYEGKAVIILFFPMAFSAECTDEMNKVQEMISDINELDADVIGISVDSPYVLEEFKKKNGYEFPLLSDYNSEVSRAYGALHAEFAFGMKNVSKRAVFVVSPERKIAYKEVLDDPSNLPNFEKIQDTLKSFKK